MQFEAIFLCQVRPLGNAIAKTFFSSFKREEVYRKDFTSEQRFRKSVKDFKTYFNEESASSDTEIVLVSVQMGTFFIPV